MLSSINVIYNFKINRNISRRKQYPSQLSIVNCRKMSFSILPVEVKAKIFNMLSIGSRYNASLVWEGMSDEILRQIPTDEFVRTNIKQGQLKITNLDDLEMAGVLASTGYLNSVRNLRLTGINVPEFLINIFKDLTNIVTDNLVIGYVNDFNFSVLEKIKCKKLLLDNMKIPALDLVKNNISVCGKVQLYRLTGNVNGLLDILTCEHLGMH